MAILHTFDKKLIRQYMLADHEVLKRGIDYVKRTQGFETSVAKEVAIQLAEEACYQKWYNSISRDGYINNEIRAWIDFKDQVKRGYYFETAERAEQTRKEIEADRKNKIGGIYLFFIMCIVVGVAVFFAPDESEKMMSIPALLVGVIGLIVTIIKTRKK